jgi:hypothetical protein
MRDRPEGAEPHKRVAERLRLHMTRHVGHQQLYTLANLQK